GDGGYDDRQCYDAIRLKGARAVIPPQRGARIWRHGNTRGERHARDENLRYIRARGRAKWKRDYDYHRRSLAEVAVFRLKMIFGAGDGEEEGGAEAEPDGRRGKRTGGRTRDRARVSVRRGKPQQVQDAARQSVIIRAEEVCPGGQHGALARGDQARDFDDGRR